MAEKNHKAEKKDTHHHKKAGHGTEHKKRHDRAEQKEKHHDTHKEHAKDIHKAHKHPAKKSEQKPEQKRPAKKVIFSIGKRKRAVARAVARPGKGMIKINSVPLEAFKDDLFRMRISEPFMLLDGDWKQYDFSVNVRGGGKMGQADAARQSLARCLVQIFGDPAKARYLEYDRNLLVYDPRRTEPHKPPRSSQGPRRYKQRSKR